MAHGDESRNPSKTHHLKETLPHWWHSYRVFHVILVVDGRGTTQGIIICGTVGLESLKQKSSCNHEKNNILSVRTPPKKKNNENFVQVRGMFSSAEFVRVDSSLPASSPRNSCRMAALLSCKMAKSWDVPPKNFPKKPTDFKSKTPGLLLET